MKKQNLLKKMNVALKSALQMLAIICLIGLQVSSAFAQRKHALIVAIGDYPEDTDWNDISSVNDIPLIEDALNKKGFAKEDIVILKNEEASKDGITAALKNMAGSVNKGDIVVVHFSSHGQQIMDDNNDELDGYDEAIVAYGAPAYYDPLYKGENHLRDEELGAMLDLIRGKLGMDGDLLLFVDACHSGTATRGAKQRGGKPAFAPPGYKGKAPSEDIGLFEANSGTRGNQANMSPMVVFSASRADEVNYEYDGYGSLSVALSRALNNLNGPVSYRTFFASVLKEMSIIAPRQTPAIEGQIDREMFAGSLVKQEKYYTAYSMRNNRVSMNGGQLNGLFVDTEVSVFPSGTVSTKDKVALNKGVIISSEGTWSTLTLDKTLEGNPSDYWFFVTSQSFGDVRIKLDISKAEESVQEKLNTWAKDFNLVELTTENSDLAVSTMLSRRTAGISYELTLSEIQSGEIIQTVNERNLFELEEMIKNRARGEFMKNLDLTDPGLDVVFEFIPLRMDGEEVKEKLSIEDITNNGIIEVNTRDIAVQIKVSNRGTRAAFFNIIDIQPDGVINGILPDPEQNHNPYDFKIEPGQSYVVEDKYVTFGDPCGTEVFKLFATEEPVDFSPIITQSATRGTMNEMEKLFDSAYSVQHRGGKTNNVKSDMQASTYSYTFKIIK